MQYAALVLTIIWVLFVFKTDVRKQPAGSHALWIPVMWMLYSASRPVSFWLGDSGSTSAEIAYVEGNPIDRAILSLLTILGLYVLSRRHIRWRQIFSNNISILLWFSYCGVSILWSDFPMVSLKRWIKEIGLVASVLIVLTETQPIEAGKTVLKRFSYSLLSFSVLLIVFFPKLGMDYSPETGVLSYVGVSYTKNNLARICLVAGFFLFCNMVALKRTNTSGRDNENTVIQLIFFAVSVGLLVITNSLTSSAALMIGIMLFVALGLRIMRENLKHLGTIIALTVVVGLVLQWAFDFAGMFVTSQGRDMTLTGRTALWKDLLAFRTNPLIGVGYGSFWLGDRLARLWDIYTWEPNESHNGYLNVYLELGYVGLCALAGVVYCAYRNIKKELASNFDYGRFRLGLFVIALLYNLTEDAIGKMTLVWFVFLAVSLDVPRQSPATRPSTR